MMSTTRLLKCLNIELCDSPEELLSQDTKNSDMEVDHLIINAMCSWNNGTSIRTRTSRRLPRVRRRANRQRFNRNQII